MTLKDDVIWADGVPITAADICFTVDAILEPQNPVTWLWMAREELSGCQVVSEKVALVKFVERPAHHKDTLNFAILPAHRFESTVIPADHPIKREVWGSTGIHARITDRRAIFKVAREVPQTRYRIGEWEVRDGYGVDDLLAGRVDGLVSVEIDDYPRVQVEDDFALKSFDLRTFWYVAIREEGALADVDTRRKLDAAIDRLALRETTQWIDPDDANPPVEFISGPFVQSSPHYNRAVKVREHEPVDLSGLTLRLGIPSRQNDDDPLLLEALANQWRSLGADVQSTVLEGVDPMAWAPTKGSGGVVDLLIISAEEPMRGFERRRDHLFGTDGKNNPLGLSIPAADELIEEGRTARTDTEQHDAMHALHQLLHEDAHALFLWKRDAKSAWSNAVRNNTIAPGMYYTDAAGWRSDR